LTIDSSYLKEIKYEMPRDKQRMKGKAKFEESTNENLTNKKKEYLKEEILDKTGKFSYLQDPIEYKKARKRM